MDIVRILIYYQYISNVLLGFQVSLGYYYMMLLAFGFVMKVIGIVFGFLLWRSIPISNKFRPVEDA